MFLAVEYITYLALNIISTACNDHCFTFFSLLTVVYLAQ